MPFTYQISLASICCPSLAVGGLSMDMSWLGTRSFDTTAGEFGRPRNGDLRIRDDSTMIGALGTSSLSRGRSRKGVFASPLTLVFVSL